MIMRLIEQEMIEALKELKYFNKDNTKVLIDEDSARVFLHNNLIATYNFVDNSLFLNDNGFQTKTTKSRLNVLCSYFKLPTIYQKKSIWYIGDNKWLGTYYTTLN